MSDERPLSEVDELFIATLELEKGNIRKAAATMEITVDYAYKLSSKLKDAILSRARDKLALASLAAVSTTIELMDADDDTEQGMLRLKASEGIMDRSGITKHTNVDVKVETDNGLFILPGKADVPPTPDETLETNES